jgi:transcriptional regulator with XRE-family HTH domain
MQFSEKLRTLMKAYSLSQYAMAKKLNVSTSMVHGWLNGSRPQRRIAGKLANHFQVSAEELMDDRKPCPKDGLTHYLEDLQSWSDEARRKYLGNQPAISEAIDKSMFASAFEVSEMALRNERARIARELRKLADSIDPPKKDKSS